MPAHNSRLPVRSQRAAPTAASCACSTTAVNTQNAACSEGNALPATSTLFRNCIEGYSDQSIAKSGARVGSSMKTAKPTMLMARDAAPNTASSRRSLASAVPSEI
jgi:hypothetical protein